MRLREVTYGDVLAQGRVWAIHRFGPRLVLQTRDVGSGALGVVRGGVDDEIEPLSLAEQRGIR